MDVHEALLSETMRRIDRTTKRLKEAILARDRVRVEKILRRIRELAVNQLFLSDSWDSMIKQDTSERPDALNPDPIEGEDEGEDEDEDETPTPPRPLIPEDLGKSPETLK